MLLWLCLFWLQTDSGNDFPEKWVFGCYFKFGQTEKHFQLTEKYSQNNENDFRFHFHFKWLPALENRRERERERERARRSPMSHQSDDRKRETERERREMIALDWWLHQSNNRTSPMITPDRRSHQSDSNAARSRLHRTIPPSPPPIEPSLLSLFLLLSIWPDLMYFFAGFCFFCEWVWNWFIFHMFTAEEVYGKLGGLAM